MGTFVVAVDASTWSSLSDALRHALTLPTADTAVVTNDNAAWSRCDDQWTCAARMSDVYTSVSSWHPREDEAWSPPPLVEAHKTFVEADRRGSSNGCMAGIACVEVYSPDGVLQCLWDKTATETYLDPNPWWVDEETGEEAYDTVRIASRWQVLGREALASYKADRERITAKMHAEHARNRQALVDRLRAQQNSNQ